MRRARDFNAARSLPGVAIRNGPLAKSRLRMRPLAQAGRAPTRLPGLLIDVYGSPFRAGVAGDDLVAEPELRRLVIERWSFIPPRSSSRPAAAFSGRSTARRTSASHPASRSAAFKIASVMGRGDRVPRRRRRVVRDCSPRSRPIRPLMERRG